MTAKELAALVDKEASLTVPAALGGSQKALEVSVRILDGREAYGRMDVLVTPVAGSGQAWVSADRVRVKGGAKPVS